MKKIESFDFKAGDRLTNKYEVISKLGSGWEGEVYKVKEVSTGIERAAKLFFPHRNQKNKSSLFYARKLHKLRQCRIIIHYHTEEIVYFEGVALTVLVSEYVEGELLTEFINSFSGKHLPTFHALHLLHALAKGLEEIHLLNEYHGDLHLDNVIVNRFGLSFELKLLDMFHWGAPTRANREKDICDVIRIFYDALGGKKYYSKSPAVVKDICCGLKSTLILSKFRNISQLREYLETLSQ